MAWKLLRVLGIVFFILAAVSLNTLFKAELAPEREHALVQMTLFAVFGMITFSLSFTENVEDPEYML